MISANLNYELCEGLKENNSR